MQLCDFLHSFFVLLFYYSARLFTIQGVVHRRVQQKNIVVNISMISLKFSKDLKLNKDVLNPLFSTINVQKYPTF
jgi:hypothetical protein